MATPGVDVSIGFRPNLDDWKFPLHREREPDQEPDGVAHVSSVGARSDIPAVHPADGGADAAAVAAPAASRQPAERDADDAAQLRADDAASIRPTATPTTPPSSAPTTPRRTSHDRADARALAVPTSTPTSYPSVAYPSNPTDGFSSARRSGLPDGELRRP